MAVLMRSSSSSIKVKDGSFPTHKKIPNTLPSTGFVRYLRNDEFVLRLSTRHSDSHSHSHSRMILPVFVSSLPSSSSNPQSEETSVQDFNGTSSSSDGATATANHVQVRFQLQRECVYGERFHIVGDDPKLGSWDPTCSIPMDWSEGHVWTVGLDDMPARKKIQFKFILLNGASENITWQPGPDRILHTWETAKTITVREDWDDDQLQTIFEEELDSVFKNETNLLIIEDNNSAEEEAFLVENIQMDINDVEEPVSFLEQDLTQMEASVIFKNLESREDDHIILVPRESTPVLVPGLIPFSNENTTEEEEEVDDDERAAADTIKDQILQPNAMDEANSSCSSNEMIETDTLVELIQLNGEEDLGNVMDIKTEIKGEDMREGNVLENIILCSSNTLKKFLTGFGFLL